MTRASGSKKASKKRLHKPDSNTSGQALPSSALVKVKSNDSAPSGSRLKHDDALTHSGKLSDGHRSSHKDYQRQHLHHDHSHSHHHHSSQQRDYDDYMLGHDHHHGDDGEESELCDHTNVDVAVMGKVSSLLSTLFTCSFKLAVPSLYRGMVQNVQDRVLKDRLMTMIEHGHGIDEIAVTSKADGMRKTIEAQFELACEEELGDIVLRLSTEDSFDLLCDLAVKHGRDLKTWGPPCACSFASCYTCLEALVESVKATPPTPPADIRPVNVTDLITFVENTVCIGAAPTQKWGKRDKWAARLEDLWNGMAEILWGIANAVDPLELPQVQSALQTLTSLNGLDLFYTVVTRELEAAQTHANGTAVAHAKPPKNGIPCRMLTPSFPTSTTGILSAQYSRMIEENRALKEKEEPADKPLRALDDEERDRQTGAEYRRALARAMREQGNNAHTASRYAEATEHYTRAMGYDPSESIYPLNRAACLLKLQRYADAERDCTASLVLNPDNPKAFFRRGIARASLGCKEEAVQDLDDALEKQKGEPAAYKELSKLRENFLAAYPLPAADNLTAEAAELKVPTVKPVPLNLDLKGKGREMDLERNVARFHNVADRLPSSRSDPDTADVSKKSSSTKKARTRVTSEESETFVTACSGSIAPTSDPSDLHHPSQRVDGAGSSSLMDRGKAQSSDGDASVDTEDRLSEGDGTTRSVGTEATSSPSPTLSHNKLSAHSHVRSLESVTTDNAAQEHRTNAHRRAKQIVATQAAFAFFFSLIVQFRSGKDLPRALGFVPSNGLKLTGEQRRELGHLVAKTTPPSVKDLETLKTLLKREVAAMEGADKAQIALKGLRNPSSDTYGDVNTLYKLRSVGVLDVKDVSFRVARFLNSPSVPDAASVLSF
ncbi:hypothetical protein IE81DRAFT_320366 [Ceraceosorus guamensis]|uniref:Uncharacterized protein n=1 Tax=Ceraceosorus guamensis TaxID=1522189 RepID=A0A316W6D6_9BASI|nr:hypothetical protein IE81DRAFT_320366 [Ceraceosorus guamensis]PWN45194.1 hypothetical protein IE81DRAFT_320366 [Ceraceosorus guamensis]